jgi:hypothetical protein
MRVYDSKFRSPSPRPSPKGRGSSHGRFVKFPKTRALQAGCRVFSLSAWERAGVRGICITVSTVALALTGCSRPVPRDSLVVAQSPRTVKPEAARDELDVRYLAGSRVIIATAAPHPQIIRVLSEGLAAAGEPVISPDGQRIVFAGKASSKGEWQIYEASTASGRVRPLTAVPGGAKDPALLPDGSLLFVSPVATLGGTGSIARVSALYVVSPGGKPRQLTFSSASVSDPTVLADGRILFVSVQPAAANSKTGQGLYTINNDGTEISAFAGQHDESSVLQRPRQLEDGRIVFVVAAPASPQACTAETVLSARPFRSRAALLPDFKARISSVQPAGNGDLLICAESQRGALNSCDSWAVFRLGCAATDLGAPVLADPDWNTTDALEASASRKPMGRLSNVDLSHNTGQILCLDVNNTTYVPGNGSTGPRATRIRVFTKSPSAAHCALGEVEVQPDGSFMAEVPADMPLGFEALDERGQVLRREPAMIWVRPGENRSCIGCHEPHNHSPKNFRPLAVRVPVPRLCGEPLKLVQNGR